MRRNARLECVGIRSPLICEAIRPHIGIPIDVRLMVTPVDELAQSFARAGAGIITFHPEASQHVDRTLSLIRDLGCRAGLALNPATSLDHLDHVMDRLDLILVMSVNPGFGGQTFIPHALAKVAAVRARIDAHVSDSGKPVLLELDGGVKVAIIRVIAAASADTFVVGSAIFGARDADGGYRTVMGELRRELAGRA